MSIYEAINRRGILPHPASPHPLRVFRKEQLLESDDYTSKELTMQIISLVQWFEFGCSELCIRIVLHPKIEGIGLQSPEPMVLLPDFGGSNGTLIYEGPFDTTKPPRAVMDAGYTASTMGSVSKGFDFDQAGFKEFLIDCGWSGDPARKPLWMPD